VRPHEDEHLIALKFLPVVMRKPQWWRRAVRWLLGITAGLIFVAVLGTWGAIQAHQLPKANGVPFFEPGACAFDDVPTDREVECGRLHVAQSRDSDGKPLPDSRLVVLPVAILKAKGPSPQADPVVFLDGGPGFATLNGLASAFTSTDWPEPKEGEAPFQSYATNNRDWIFFDQRGTGDSVPHLGCGISFIPFLEELLEPMSLCDDWHRATGVDLGAYNGAAIARDLADLRTVKGYNQWNVIGVSYGTRTALVTARDAPAGLRAMVLDGVAPPGVRLTSTDPTNTAMMVRKVLADCAAQPDCNRTYPNLTKRLENALADWSSPQKLNWFGGRKHLENFYFFLNVTLYDPQGVALLPENLTAILDGDKSIIQRTNDLYDGAAAGSVASHYCGDIMPFETYAGFMAQSARDPIAKAFSLMTEEKEFNTCSIEWPTGAVRTIEQQAVTSPVPTLLMSAAIDPGTPPSNAAFAARTLPNSQSVVAPNGTHGISLSSSCGRAIMHRFLDSPSAPVDTSCFGAQHSKIEFVLPYADSLFAQ
jgi:pimeloyl-ACP methyl ester carboxylesterase